MKIFNLDLHISVIADIQQLFQELGHEVTSWNMSGHNWVFGRGRFETSVIKPDNWHNINQEMCDRFYETYKDQLSHYDAFLVTYAPVFAMLFEKWGKPIIIDAPIRYEVPFTLQPEAWENFNEFIRKGVDRGQVFLVANSKYDSEYGKYFTDREWTHIPSICGYTNSSYNPQQSQFLYYSRFSEYTQYCGNIPNLVEKSKALGRNYKWNNLVQYKGIVGLPYCPSTMSIFEFYTQNIPLFFPTIDLMVEMKSKHNNKVMEETSWNQTWNREPGSKIRPGPNDPNDYVDMNKFRNWVQYSDFYDTGWMPHIQYFNSWDELKNTLQTISNDRLIEISNAMKNHNVVRKEKVKQLWNSILQKIKG
jgi:hypothetical protein